MDPTLDGNTVFGTACHVAHAPNRAAVQRDAFPGINGEAALFLGSRGRTFAITGLFVGENLSSVIAAEGLLLTYADGIARTFTDTQGRSWPNVIFEGEYRPSPEGPKPTDFGWCLPYQCTLHGLS